MRSPLLELLSSSELSPSNGRLRSRAIVSPQWVARKLLLGFPSLSAIISLRDLFSRNGPTRLAQSAFAVSTTLAVLLPRKPCNHLSGCVAPRVPHAYIPRAPRMNLAPLSKCQPSACPGAPLQGCSLPPRSASLTRPSPRELHTPTQQAGLRYLLYRVFPVAVLVVCRSSHPPSWGSR